MSVREASCTLCSIMPFYDIKLPPPPLGGRERIEDYIIGRAEKLPERLLFETGCYYKTGLTFEAGL